MSYADKRHAYDCDAIAARRLKLGYVFPKRTGVPDDMGIR